MYIHTYTLIYIYIYIHMYTHKIYPTFPIYSMYFEYSIRSIYFVITSYTLGSLLWFFLCTISSAPRIFPCWPPPGHSCLADGRPAACRPYPPPSNVSTLAPRVVSPCDLEYIKLVVCFWWPKRHFDKGFLGSITELTAFSLGMCDPSPNGFIFVCNNWQLLNAQMPSNTSTARLEHSSLCSAGNYNGRIRLKFRSFCTMHMHSCMLVS